MPTTDDIPLKDYYKWKSQYVTLILQAAQHSRHVFTSKYYADCWGKPIKWYTQKRVDAVGKYVVRVLDAAGFKLMPGGPAVAVTLNMDVLEEREFTL